MPTPLTKLNLPALQKRARTILEKPLQQDFGIHDPLEDEIEEAVVAGPVKKKTPLKKILLVLQG